MLSPVLKLSNINKKLSDFFSLKNISIEFYGGEVHVLMGENGSGKSSLMNVIWGAYPKDSGDILIDNVPVSINSPIDAKKLGIAMIHQNSSLFENFTVAENIFIDNKPYSNKLLKTINKSKMYSLCEDLFNKLGFSLNCKSIVKDLNLAQKQIVEICRAYVSNARIFIMDEPTSSLTDSESYLLFKIIEELKKSGAAIIYISHKLEEIHKIADKITVIRGGEIIGTQEVKSMEVNNIIHMMTGMELKNRYPKLHVKIGKEVLKVNNLSSDNIIKNINFSLKKREILGIIGLVGSGRTKIAKSLFGIDKLDSGEIFIENKKVNINSPKDAIEAGIGYVTEDRIFNDLFMYLNIHENISAPNISRVSNKHIIDKKIESKIANSYIKRLRINAGTVNNKIAYLSGGNQQKVVLAKWIMSKSKILILDEPTKGIDIASKVDVYNIMNEMVTKDVSIILISSDIDEVIGMCDRIMVLYNGNIAAMLKGDSATRENIMFYATGGK
ncbi:monosaccharide ABC transporter ATP-binding protein, CUT2 family [Clostridium sp. USBA 49]|uniref:sugar ABC transporter ATP-binding protein n=1 Tax=Clostridium sp. USBA 49 TaxID=1881060 RepID=UPI0009D61B8E|nr:sugar ABC transporter ATP-binding protein [Clostridium sp. USBA 49]SKA83093.1 monosaccharide ABC transporter ATP-binding protein, CUT2 family [Clostridium sp. USBA 49]